MTANTATNGQQIQRLLNVVVCEPEQVTRLSVPEMDLAFRIARRVRLLGRLGKKLASAGHLHLLPTIAADQLRSNIAMADARSRVALWEAERVASALHQKTSAPLVVMKGCTYLLLDLPNAPGRIFADLDLLTSEAELENIEAILNSSGWSSQELTPYDQNYYRKWTHELPPLTHPEREVEIDLHHNIVPRTARLNPNSKLLLDAARVLPNSRYSVLANEDIVLHAMTHLMFDSELADKLRDLVDISDLIEHFAQQDASFWDTLVRRAPELDLTRPAYYSIYYANLYLGLAVPQNVASTIDAWSPWAGVQWLMDKLVPCALYPQHPDFPSSKIEFYRLLLFVRSHWLRMPPWLLAYHLTVKFVRKRLTGNKEA